MTVIRSEIQLLYSFMKYDYEKLISPSFREFYKLYIDIQVCGYPTRFDRVRG